MWNMRLFRIALLEQYHYRWKYLQQVNRKRTAARRWVPSNLDLWRLAAANGWRSKVCEVLVWIAYLYSRKGLNQRNLNQRFNIQYDNCIFTVVNLWFHNGNITVVKWKDILVDHYFSLFILPIVQPMEWKQSEPPS